MQQLSLWEDARPLHARAPYRLRILSNDDRKSAPADHGLPALIYDHRCSGSEAYMALAREVVGRLPKVKVAA